MPTVIDANVLVALFSKHSEDRRDVRVRGLIEDARSSRSRLIVPAPVLAEFAVRARDDELEFITSQAVFKVASFDGVAALECGFLIREAFSQESKRERHAIKFDLQILAIAKVFRADRLVTNDKQLKARSASLGIQALSVLDLPIPENEKQIPLSLGDTD